MKLREKITRTASNAIGKVANAFSGGLSQDVGEYAAESFQPIEGMWELLCRAGEEGAVLLKNHGVLPFDGGEKISLFGRVQLNWFYVGYGSGGDVNRPYSVNLVEGLRNQGANLNEALVGVYEQWCEKNPPDEGFWGHWPHYYQEMPITAEIVEAAAKSSDCAVVVVGRAAGEDRENYLTKGSYYLTEEETQLLSLVCSRFKRTVAVLNVGNIIDMSWVDSLSHKPGAVLMAWQGGMESGNALARVLLGKAEPSGRLTDTIAKSYEAYPSSNSFGNKEFNCYTEDIFVGYRYFETFRPENVLYPFGFGLGYAKLRTRFEKATLEGDRVTLKVKVRNTGKVYPGKQVVQVYVGAPQGKLGKPAKVLAAFEKTKLLEPGREQTLTLCFPLSAVASYDDSGKSGNKSCYVLERGEYAIYVGTDVRSAEKAWAFTLEEDVVTECLSEVSAPTEGFRRLTVRTAKDGSLARDYESVPKRTVSLRDVIVNNLPEELPKTGDMGLTLGDVKNGDCTLEQFTAQLSLEELEAISRGDYTMDSPLGAKGNAGAFGGVTESLRDKGVPAIITTDGPSGIRLKSTCSLLPIGTALACTWNRELERELYALVGEEMKQRGSDVLLAPGMNIHRNPLCGRNFEYYSEDPLLTGETAAAVVSGIQSAGVSACPKHFACNNQETNRNYNDSRLSERALREIYLKGFEICVKQAKPKNIMTSYNKINGVWGHYNYELCTSILRGEWGYGGNVMTDWWMRKSKSPEFPKLRDNGYRVRAQVDVLMPGGDRVGKRVPDGTLLKTLGKKDGITLSELQRTAMNVLRLCLDKIK